MDMLQSLQNTLDRFLEYIPQLIGAIIILVIGYIVARILKAVVSRILQGIGFDGWMERGGIKQFLDRAQTRETPATVLGLCSSSPSPWPLTLSASSRSRRSWRS
jgi:hypothetical protein